MVRCWAVRRSRCATGNILPANAKQRPKKPAAPVVAKVAEFRERTAGANGSALRKAADVAEENPVSEKQPAPPAAAEPSRAFARGARHAVFAD